MRTKSKRGSKPQAEVTRSKTLRPPSVAPLRRATRDDGGPTAAPSTPIAVEAMAGATEVVSGRERLVFSSDKEIVFRCGSASVTLMADGTVLIKGTRLVSSSSGLNRIRGAAVKIN
jgi:hypothetical protein